MAGTTSPFGFPYPTGTDRVADGDNAIQALAERVDDTLAGATAGVALSTSMSNVGGGTMTVVRGSMVTLAVECRPDVPWNPTWALFIIEQGYRPARRFVFNAATVPGGATTGVIVLQVLADGRVMTVADATIPTGTNIYGSISYALAI